MESEKKQRLVIDGNAFYEIDLKCLEEKRRNRKPQKNTGRKGRGSNLCPFCESF